MKDLNKNPLLNNEKIKSEEFSNIDFRLADEYLILLESKLNESGGTG
ncbi:hypothetical protein AB6F55_12210 [Providencia hangzhouensis]